MKSIDSLLKDIGYDCSPHYCHQDESFEPETVHIFRSAHNAGAHGIYLFETGSSINKNLSRPRCHPAVYVAEANDEKEARSIHRKLWNLRYAPFLIILLPHQVRIYSGFNYQEDNNKGLLDTIENYTRLNEALADFTAESIDTGRIWESDYAKKIDPNRRVDYCLLENLKKLGKALVEKKGLNDGTAHALIGKYVYLRYLRDRKILSDRWMEEHLIDPESVFSRNATVTGLKKLVDILEDRFNGKIFPIDFDNEPTLMDEHVKLVSAIFSGDEIIDTGNTPDIVRQLSLPFKAYDFEYIPVETLSSIYEQFIFERKEKGAVYTPEIVADYLVSEMETVKEIARGMKILDPACGSGVFLVLVYRRLIEIEIRRLGRKPGPFELIDILLESIYGIERERDACFVAEFSLILTLLHYLEPRDLQNLKFRFPALHNRQVFECDFFDIHGKPLNFDWIIGNPPWIELKPGMENERFALAWMSDKENKKTYPIGGKRTAEAFSWLVTGLLSDDGVVGLLLPATSLFNSESGMYRQRFFAQHEVLRVMNFANLENLFQGRANYPAAAFVYRKFQDNREKQDIIHYGPFTVNQLSEPNDKQWVITIDESEIKTIPHEEAERGETLTWKLALWGTYHDRRTIERILSIFPGKLGELCDSRGWTFCEGPQLREKNKSPITELKYVPEIKGKKRFNINSMRDSSYRYSIPDDALDSIPDEMCYIRKRGGEAGLVLTQAPHILISSSWMSYVVYSDNDFVIPPRQMGIASPGNTIENGRWLKALSVYLNSLVISYYMFFHAQEWGVFRHANRVTVKEARKIPIPLFTPGIIDKLVKTHDELAQWENKEILRLNSSSHQKRLNFGEIHEDKIQPKSQLSEAEKIKLRDRLQQKIDEEVCHILKIPDDIRSTVEEFFKIRLLLGTSSSIKDIKRKPTAEELKFYATELRDELDAFLMGRSYHRVSVTYSNELIECAVEITGEKGPICIDDGSVKKGSLSLSSLMAELSDNLRKQIGQWVYIQRGLRLFDGPRAYIYKKPRLIDWTGTQAKIDAGDIIGEAIAAV